MAFRVVDGHSVGRDVDTRTVGAAHTEAAVANSGSGIARRYDRGGHFEEGRDVATIVAFRYLLGGDVGECDRSLHSRTVSRHFDGVEGGIHTVEALHKGLVSGLSGRSVECGRIHNRHTPGKGLLHVFKFFLRRY